MMESIFIRSIRIDRVTHLENIDINVCDCECKNIIITGKNGSGKTILLD
jgi:predicted ATP-binding protein involved in virulence